MKQLRWVWILGIAAVLLTVLFIFVDRRSKQQEEIKKVGEPKQLLQINSDLITDISLKNEEGTTVFTWDDTANTWVITEGEQFNVNVYAISAICNYACSLSSLKTVAFDCDNTDIYGFQDPVTLKIYTTETGKEHPYIIYIGDATPTYDSYYAMVDGSNDVYTIDYNSGTVFCATRNSMKNPYLFDTSASLVTYYRVEKEGETVIELKRNQDRIWEMLQPAPFNPNISEINELIDKIIRVELASYVEDNPEDLSKYGLDHPHTKVWLEGSKGDQQMKEEIWFGDLASSNENETKIYGYFANTRQVFMINRAETTFADQNVTDFVYPSCVDLDIKDLQSVEIDMGEVYDLHETLRMDYAKNQYSLGDIDITAKNDENIMQLYQTFYRTVSTLRFSEIQLDEQPDPEKEAAIRIVYTYQDGKTLTLEFIERTENEYYFVEDGTYSGLTVRLNRFTSPGGIIDRYKLLQAAL